MLPTLGPLEILVVLVVALVVFGPEKLPQIARQVANGVREFRRVQEHLRGELDEVMGQFGDQLDLAPRPNGEVPELAPPQASPDLTEAQAPLEPPAAGTPVDNLPAGPYRAPETHGGRLPAGPYPGRDSPPDDRD